MNDARYYLKLLDDFITHGDIPERDDNVASHPWLHEEDALFDYLVTLMRDPETQAKVLSSKIRGRVFYTTVGRFVMDCVHHHDFQKQRQWTERTQSEKVLSWSDGMRRDHWQSLLQQIDSDYGDEGFQKQFFQQLFSRDGGWKKQENWEKLTHDWRGCMNRRLQTQLGSRIKAKCGGQQQALDLAMKQLEAHIRSNGITEDKALQAWDMMEGQWTETEFEKRLKTVKIQDRYPEISEVAKKMGRMADANGRDRLTVSKGTTMKLPHSSGSDIEGITVGNDLNALLPIELAEYGDDTMGDLFMYKYLTKNLQTFRYKSQVSKPSRRLGFTHASRKGPMIVCIDTSASMYGTAQTIERSLLSKVCQVAEELQRPCFLIDFSVSVRPVDLMEQKRQQRMKQLSPTLIAERDEKSKEAIPFINGGTSAANMLATMFEVLDNEGNCYVNADVLWITDFLIPMAETSLLSRMKLYRQTGTKFYGMQISSDEKAANEWERYFDKIYHIYYRQIRRY